MYNILILDEARYAIVGPIHRDLLKVLDLLAIRTSNGYFIYKNRFSDKTGEVTGSEFDNILEGL